MTASPRLAASFQSRRHTPAVFSKFPDTAALPGRRRIIALIIFLKTFNDSTLTVASSTMAFLQLRRFRRPRVVAIHKSCFLSRAMFPGPEPTA